MPVELPLSYGGTFSLLMNAVFEIAGRGKTVYPYSGRIHFVITIVKNKLKEVNIVDGKTEKELVSILMESPLYFVLGLKERYSLLSRLMEVCEDKKIAEFPPSPKSASSGEI